MADDAWHVQSSAANHRPSIETRPASETRLLHELIIQAVTERRIDVDPTQPYDKQLQTTIRGVQATDEYKDLLSRGNVTQTEVATLLDHQHLQRLPTVDSANHVTMMMATGGPATGKSSIIKIIQRTNPEIYSNTAKINPDDYKPLLADRKIYGKDFADVAHAESSKLAAEIMTRLEQKMSAGRSPHIVMDVVATSEHRMNFAKQAGQLIVVTGVVPVDVAVDRSYDRAKDLVDGRRISTEVVISGARNVAAELPRVFDHPDVKFLVINTDVPYGSPNKPVAQLKNVNGKQTLVVSDPDIFIDLVGRQNLNIHAQAPTELYRPQDRSPATIAQGLKAYTDKGVTLAFLDSHGQVAMTMGQNGAQQIHSLASKLGNSFYAELAGAVTALAGRQTIEQRAQVEERTTTDAAQGKRTQNPIPVVVPPNDHAQTPPPVVVTRQTPPESQPVRIAMPSKIGIAGTAVSLAIGPVYEAGLAAANDGNASDITKAGLQGLANSALPGVTNGFKNITENNQHQNWLDQTLNAGTTATQGTAVGALAVAGSSALAAPVTGGTSLTVTAGSLVVAGVAGVANLGIGVAHDLTYWTGLSKQGGLITGIVNMGVQLADSKAAHRAGDWVMNNDDKIQQQLAARGMQPNQLAAVDENKDGKVSAQETRNYLIRHHVPAEQVNSLPAKQLADKLISVVAPANHAAVQPPAHTHLSPEMQRALGMAASCNLSASIRCDTQHQGPLQSPVGLQATTQRAQAAQGR
ncbi:MAG: zeta toxin family protein [Alphaproteobacteria bacterium]|nr:zeta toxin family protein [Alphaproteobacteria bacterium]